MVGKLHHKEGLADFRGTGKEIGAAVKQAVNERRPRWEHCVIKLGHHDCVQIDVGVEAGR